MLLFLPYKASAHGVTVSIGYYGTNSTSTTYMLADSSANDDLWIDLKVGGGDGQVIWFDHNGEIGRSSTPGIVNAPSNANAFKLKSNDGKEVYAIEGHTTNPNSEHVNFSGSNGSTDPEPEDPTPTPTPVPEEPDCTLCECRDDLVNAMAAINSSVNSNGQKISDVVDGVKDLNAKASQSNNLLDGILGELKSDLMPNMPSMPEPPSLSDNKPNMPDQAYKNDNSYFSDKGETSKDPKPLPTAPEPENWKGEDGKVINPEDEMDKDPSNKKDPQKNRDDELSKDDENQKDDEFSKDDEFYKDDSLTKDDEFNRDTEMDKDKFQQDLEMDKDKQQDRDVPLESDREMNRDTVSEIDDEYNRDPVKGRDNWYSDSDVLEQSPVMGRDNFYNQSPVDHTPPDWKSD